MDELEEQELHAWMHEEPLTEIEKEALDIFNAVGDGLVTIDDHAAMMLKCHATKLPVTHVYSIDPNGFPVATRNPNVRHGNWLVIATKENSQEEIDRAVHDA
ncbi:uncharacterized protein LOC127751080 [Frankliniella occidentalis]|uniref:Uncharacterized protein LOC127751080 n=1 Tax=Frankliniella occidentalis TaxID=133901 RepID=A0A9C6XT22_FRAOC|nr:uncharacterized protein LOC127751080 [Frankliniella occidentalis]